MYPDFGNETALRQISSNTTNMNIRSLYFCYNFDLLSMMNK